MNELRPEHKLHGHSSKRLKSTCIELSFINKLFRTIIAVNVYAISDKQPVQAYASFCQQRA